MNMNQPIELASVAVTINPKDLLEKDHMVLAGDFATTNDDSPLKIYIAGSEQKGLIPLYSIGLTSEGDDIYVKRFFVKREDAIFVDDSHVNFGGILWKLRDMLKDDPEF